ncbi:MAG: 50S ribosomal protein L3 [Candidatus Magasanikbacteria bacterium]|nr:50S ribosomal protein L3 [Candidatus Magasanikbacteria bacterium]
MKFIVGKKLGMTQVFREDGTIVPVTRVQAGPCVVTQIKTQDRDGVDSVQVGFGSQKKFRINKAQQGHLKDLDDKEGNSLRYMRDFRVDAVVEQHGLKRGDMFTVKIFAPGEKVEVQGKSKGKGFQGVVKRHGFHGSPATHGHKDQLRMSGSIGAGGVGRVFKGVRMGGHMGSEQVTVKNLEVVEVHPENHELFIKGAIPGARNTLILISSEAGSIQVESAESPSIAQAEQAAVSTADLPESPQMLDSEKESVQGPDAEALEDNTDKKIENATADKGKES